MPQLYDAFISYGRADSKAFAAKLCQWLTEQHYRVWFDLNDIPLGVDYQKQIDDDLERSHNFIFLMSPHSINSQYCRLEIERAVRCHKRIIPVLHVDELSRETWQKRHPKGTDADWAEYQGKKLHLGDVRNPRIHPILGKINWIYAREEYDDLEAAFAGIRSVFERHQDYVHEHTRWLVKALEWEKHQRRSQFLLIGEERQRAEAWLTVRFHEEQLPCTPTDLHAEYITESTKNANNLMTHVFLSSADADHPFREKIRRSLMGESFTVWSNKVDVKTGEDFRRAIAQGIEAADNVVLILSPQALTSEYCRQEIAYAQRLNKRVIPLLAVALEGNASASNPLQDSLKNLQYIDFRDPTDDAFNAEMAKLIRVLHQDAVYYNQHKVLLVKALKWKRQNKNTSILLRGNTLNQATAWLKTAKGRSHHPPTDLHQTFIAASLNHPQEPSLEVFISYSRTDADMARRLNSAIQTQGKTTWFDQESIASGTDFQQEIYRGIEQCDNFLFVLSPQSVNSPYCADEVDYAAKLNKRIVTVLYRPVDANTLHPALASVQWIDFNQHGGNFYANFSELIRTLDTDRGHVHHHTRWLQRSLEWHAKDQTPDLLLRGSEVVVAEEWLKTAVAANKQPSPTEGQRAFIQASCDAIEAERRKERRQMVVLRSLLGLVSVVAAIALGTSVWAVRNQRIAQRKEVVSSIAQANAETALNYYLDALLSGLRAGRSLQDNGWLRRDAELQQQAAMALQTPVYQVRHRNRLVHHDDWVIGLDYSPDGSSLVSASIDGTLHHWQQDGTLIDTNNHTTAEGDYLSATFSPDGQTIALLNQETADFWTLDGERIHSLPMPIDTAQVGLNESVLSPDHQHLALIDAEGSITLWDTADGTRFTPIPLSVKLRGTPPASSPFPPLSEPDALDADDAMITQAAFSADGDRLAAGTAGGMVYIWGLDGTLLQRFQGHDGAIDAIAFSPDGELIAVGGDGNAIHLWWNDGAYYQTFEYTDTNIYIDEIRFSPDGQTLAVGMSNHAIALWNISGVPTGTLWGHNDQVNQLVFSPDGQTLASGSDDNTVHLWTMTNPLSSQWEAHEVRYSAASGEAPFITAIYGEDGHVDSWHPDGRWRNRIDSLDDLEQAFLNEDGTVIITVQANGLVQRWTVDGEWLQTLLPLTEQFVSADLTPDGRTLVTAGELGPVQIWDTDGSLLKTVIGENQVGDYIDTVMFAGHSKALILGYQGGLVQHFDVETSVSTVLHDGLWNLLSVSADGQWFALEDYSKTLTLTDLHTQAQTVWDTGHRSTISDIQFSPDGQQLVTTSTDSTARFWAIATPDAPVTILRNPMKQVVSQVNFRPDGAILATGNHNDLLTFRILPGIDNLDHLVQRGCEHLRDFLRTNPEISPDDRALCDTIPPLPYSEWPHVPRLTVPLPSRE